MRGFSKRIKRLEDASSRTVYTLGPASGAYDAYDIEWAGANANPAGGIYAPVMVLKDGRVEISGSINFSGARTDLEFPIPDELRPFRDVRVPVCIFDNGVGRVWGQLYIPADPSDGDSVISIIGGGGAFAAGDGITLSSSYLVGPSDAG